MAENQTAAEDSGQQSTTQHQTHSHHNQQQQQQQQQQQHHHQHSHNNDHTQILSLQNSEEISSTITSPSTPPNENNSASSPDEPQTIVIANHHNQQQTNQIQQHTQTQQQQERSMIDRQVNTKIKTIRRNTIQTTTVPVRAASTTSIKKPALTKTNSLTGSTTGNAERNSTTTSTEKHHQQQQQHHHHHNQHNSMTNRHHHYHYQHHYRQNNSSPSHVNNSNSTAIQRTTSESLRLNASPSTGGSNTGATGGGDSLSNATSNSSIHSNMTNNSSSSASVAPKSTSSTASRSKSTTSKSSSASSKAISPNNNNNSIALVTAGSSHASRTHHSHGPIQSYAFGQNAGTVVRKPKTTSSFQITSVTVGHPKAPVAIDNGEDESADDLDESHTDDNSRITDLENETPSMSEDTFSKEEIYYHQDDSLSSTAPAIPTSSQYGLVVTTLGAQEISNVQVNVGENFINVVPSGSGIKKEDLKDSAQHRSERFKVVKIESTEPFRRGRWVCMDYLDHSSVSGKEDGTGGPTGNNNEKTEAGAGIDNGEQVPKTTQSMILGPGAAAALENHIEPFSASTADGNWNFPDTSVNQGGGIATAPATVAHGMQQFIENAEGKEQSNQIIQQEPQYQTPPQEVNANATPQMAMTAPAPMDYATVAAQKLKKSLEELKKQEEAIAASEKAAAVAGGVYLPGQSQPVNFDSMQQQQQVAMPQPQQVAMQQQQQHAATLPGNLNIQNGNITIATDNNNVAIQQQPQQQQMIVETQQQTYNVETAQQQQNMSPAPQQIQVPPSFITASFQATPQQTPPQQSPQMQETGQPMQQQAQQMTTQQQIPQQQQQMQQIPQQQPQMQQVTPQQTPSVQLQQQTSQTDGVTNIQNVAAVANIQLMQQQHQTHAQAPQQQQQQQQPQLPPQFQQLQQQQQPLAPGQTMPVLTQITGYDMQHQQQQQQQQHQLQQQQSAPATMLDNTALLATLQAQQQQSTSTNTLATASNILMQPAATALANTSSPYQQQQQQQPISQLSMDGTPPTGVSAHNSNITANLNPITTAAIAPITAAVANAASSNNTSSNIDNPAILQSQQQQQQQQIQPPQQQPPTASQLQTTQQQLQQNTEIETERNVSSLTQAMSTDIQRQQGNNRKRAFSTPYMTAFEQQMLANAASGGSEQPQLLMMPVGSGSVGGQNEQNIYFYNKSSSGGSSFCVDESMWPNGQVQRFMNNNNPSLVTHLGSDSNIYTNLALGNERYKLPDEFLSSVSPSVSITSKREGDDEDDLDELLNENVDELEESADQFSPLLYPASQQSQRSQPIAISAGNSPVHKPKESGVQNPPTSGPKSPKHEPSSSAGLQRQHMAFSVSPTAGLFPYNPFVSGSLDGTHAANTAPSTKIPFSYDPSYGANIHHLPLPSGQQQHSNQQQHVQQKKQLPRQPPLPQQRHSQPSTGSQLTSPILTMQKLSASSSIESGPGAIMFATSPTSSLSNSASGTSAVAIDNKIEQAMDLVKSHLMIAVREEVEVLKEKISELMDKINQLEVENTILKANISQETLQQLQMQTQLQIAGSTPTNGSNMITGTPTQAAIAAAPITTVPPLPAAAANAVANAAINANSNSSTAAATPQSNVGSGTATPTSQQPSSTATVEQNMEATQLANIGNTDDSQASVQATNGPMS